MLMLDILIFNTTNILVLILVVPLIGAFILLFIPSINTSMLKTVALSVSCVEYLISLVLWVLFNKATGSFQFANKVL